jgi:hypothetical protein
LWLVLVLPAILWAIQEGQTLSIHWLARFAADRIDKLVGAVEAGFGGQMALLGKNSFSGVPE